MDFKGCLVVVVFCSSFLHASNHQAELADRYLALSIVALVPDKNSKFSAVDQINMQICRLENVYTYFQEKKKREILKMHLMYHLYQLDKEGDDVNAKKHAIKNFVKPHQAIEKHFIRSQDFKNVYRLFNSKHILRSYCGDRNAYWLWPSRLDHKDVPDCVNKCKSMIKAEIEKIDAYDIDCRNKLSEEGVIIDQELVPLTQYQVNDQTYMLYHFHR